MDLDRLYGKYHRATEPEPGVLLLEFNRPPLNPFNDPMWAELKKIVDNASSDINVRVIVLSSTSDKAFTAGLDPQSVIKDDSIRDPARKAIVIRQHLIEFQAAISSLSECRVPVIAALHGICLGLAVDIASACDIRVAAADTTFGIVEITVGLAADIGTLQRFPKVTGNDSLARELALTGRKFNAAEGKDIGFISKIISGSRKEVVAASMEIAREIASKSPIAVVSTKHLMNHARDHSITEGLAYTAAWNGVMLQSTDTSQAMDAVLAKKKATFPNLGEPQKAKL